MHTRFAILVAVTLSTSAAADAPKYKRVQQAPPPPPAAAAARIHPPPSAEPAHPTVTSDDILVGIERTQTLRREQEAILLKLIADTPDSDPDKPDYFFRLAEQYAQQQRFWRLKANAPSRPQESASLGRK